MSGNTPRTTAWQRHSSNLLHSVSNFKLKSSVTLKVLIIIQKYLFNLILKPISKFPKVLTI